MIDLEDRPLDHLYFEWLYKQVASIRNQNPRRSYWNLMKYLYDMPFVWELRNDEHRAEDGKKLRHEFIEKCDIQDVEVNWLQLECSVLEMLIGLARRASFESQGEPLEWFWQMLENLGLRDYSDAVWNDMVAEDVEDTMFRVMNRTYEANGDGGLFPLENATDDQRAAELWKQMSCYIIEGGYLDHGF
ncbi:hypothetical protein SEA_ZEINA_60 [Arthrobacter phage Zeina]|nr:hypothetical protein SEA_ZEINA_60 [Arthrobacter phage Zeina]